MKAGEVFRWDKFPFYRDPKSELKPRYFIYLGNTGIFHTPVFLFMVTTTTKKLHYEKGGTRESFQNIRIKAGQFGFPEECIIDLITNFYSNIEYDTFIRAQSNITVIGKLDEEMMRRVYKLVLVATNISPKIKKDIHSSFNLAGITGLRMP